MSEKKTVITAGESPSGRYLVIEARRDKPFFQHFVFALVMNTRCANELPGSASSGSALVFAKRRRKSLQSTLKATTPQVSRRGRACDIGPGFRKLGALRAQLYSMQSQPAF